MVMLSRDSRQETPEKTNQIKFLQIENFQKEKPPNLHHDLNPKLYNSGEVLTRPPLQQQQQRFEGRFSLGAAAPCVLLPVSACRCNTSLSFLRVVYCCCEKECEIGRCYQATTKLAASHAVGKSLWAVIIIIIWIFFVVLVSSSPPSSSSFFLIINQDRFD